MRRVPLKFSGWLLFLAALSVCLAAAKGLSGPTLGFVAVSDRELRPILGIPGAAHLGAAIPLPESVTKLHIAPGSGYALAEQSDDRPPGVVRLRIPSSDADGPIVNPIGGALPEANAIAFSPTGKTAAIYVASASVIEVITGLPDSPAVTAKLSTSSISHSIQKLAVSDNGELVLAADSSSVYSLRTGSVPTIEFTGKNISSMSFLSNSHDAVVCDRSRNIVTLLSWIGSNFEVSTLSTNIPEPETLASYGDGRTILITTASQSRIWAIDRTSGLVKDYPLGHHANQLSLLSSKDIFLLSPPVSATYWVLSWKDAGPSTFFIGGRTN